MIYEESYESKSLMFMNQELMKCYYSKENQLGVKLMYLKNQIKNCNFNFIMDVILKHKSKNISVINGNEKFHIVNSMLVNKKYKVAVYTCIVGNYDTLKEPLFINKDIDYIVFTDQHVDSSSIWKKIDITKYEDYNNLTPTLLNRKIKILCNKYLPYYDFTIYIDGNIRIVADLYPIILSIDDKIMGVHTHAGRDCIYDEANAIIKVKKGNASCIEKQINNYKIDGFPRHFGLFQNSILVRNHAKCDLLMKKWWEEYSLLCTRDQLSLPYIIWKNNISCEEIAVLGMDASKNPRFQVKVHK